MNQKHLINAIYRATEGEGIFLGRPQVFVRYQGCAIGCLNCDSRDTWDFSDSHEKSLEEIMTLIKQESLNGKIKSISITGGDPLHPGHVPHVLSLTKLLKEKNYYINIEASGMRIVDEVFDLVDFISFDFKTPSTGVKTPVKNISRLIENYRSKFQIKSVIFDYQDFSATLEAYKELEMLHGPLSFSWVLTPCFNNNEAFPMERFSRVIEWNENAGGLFRVIGQQHKWIFGPNKKNV